MRDLGFLPNSGIIFLDNCIFSTSLRNKFSKQELNEDREQFKNLQKTFSVKDNWLVIPEIIEEFEKGNNYLYRLNEEIDGRTLFKNLTKNKFSKNKAKKLMKKIRVCNERKGYIDERRYFLNDFLMEDFRDATGNLTEEKYQRMKELIRKIKPMFLKNNNRRKFSDLNTDCKLIATALVYAETNNLPSKDANIYLFSYDNPLLETFVDATKKLDLNLENTFVINKTHSVIPSWKYRTNRDLQYS